MFKTLSPLPLKGFEFKPETKNELIEIVGELQERYEGDFFLADTKLMKIAVFKNLERERPSYHIYYGDTVIDFEDDIYIIPKRTADMLKKTAELLLKAVAVG